MKIHAKASLQMHIHPSYCAKACTSDLANARTSERANAFTTVLSGYPPETKAEALDIMNMKTVQTW